METDLIDKCNSQLQDLCLLIKQNAIIIDKLNDKLNQFNKQSKSQKGANCSREGSKYELQVWKVCKDIYYNEKPFCVMSKKELAGSNTGYDITCLFNDEIIPIEIKKFNAPDWTQVVITIEDGIWVTKRTNRSKAQEKVQDIFDAYLKDKDIFKGKLPPPVYEDWTHEKWVEYKRNNDFQDYYIYDCPDNLIANVHAAKGVEYIQISEYGLYHTGKNICGFNVPKFIHKARIRIRTKIHSKYNAKGFMNMSVTASLQPVPTGFSLQCSLYSLDCTDKIPPDPSIS